MDEVANQKQANEVGKTAYDIAWLVYKDIKESHADKFETPHDHLWWLRMAMEAATMSLDPEREIERQAMLGYMNKK